MGKTSFRTLSQRSQGNSRLYSIDELGKVVNFSLLNKNGYKVSHLAAITNDELKQKIKEIDNNKGKQQRAVKDLIICMYQLDTEKFEMIFDTLTAAWPIDAVLTEIVYKFLQKTGLLWKGNRLTEEHFVVTSLRSKIILGTEKAGVTERKNKKIVLFIPETGQLDLMLLYTKYILKIRGFQVLYMGNDISIDNLKAVIQLKQPNYIFTYLPKRTKFKLNELSAIMFELIPKSKLVIANKERRGKKINYGNVIQLDYEDALTFMCE